MLIAIPYDNETKQVFPSTGSTEIFYFAQVDRKEKKILKEGFAETERRTHHELPLFLSQHHVDVRICTHLGRPLLTLRNQNGRKVYLTNTRDIFQTVSLFRADKLIEATEEMAHDCSCGHSF